MVYNNRIITLYVNNREVDLSPDGLNITMDNQLFDPKEIKSEQAEFSYSFSLPATSNNNVILNFGNTLDRPNRFRGRFKSTLYVDERELFSGILMVTGFQDNAYQCNLVSPKIYNLEDIFGEATLYDIGNWYAEFNGAESINKYNKNGKDFTFPLISYGVFEKSPYYSDSVANDYTDKFQLDKTNKWYVESFYPSINMLSVIKKAFAWKGYNVEGDVFHDTNLNNIYLSTNLSQDQIPVYNLGNPKFGSILLSASITAGTNSGYEQELQFPYFEVKTGSGTFLGSGGVGSVNTATDVWNWDNIRLYDILGEGNVTVNNDSYLFDPNEKCIVIPADGWYKIYLHADTYLDYSTTSITASQSIKVIGSTGQYEVEEKDLTIPIGIDEATPVEIQLVRNYSDNIELIKGKRNKKYDNGNPTETQYKSGTRYYQNVYDWKTCFPHEDPYSVMLPTKRNELSLRNTTSRFGGNRSTSGSTRADGGFGGNRSTGGTRYYSSNTYGYAPKDMELMCYDPAVNGDFICGFTSFLGGCPSVIKDGYSWSASYSTEHQSYYKQSGYNLLYSEEGESNTVYESATTFNQHEYKNAPSTMFSTGSTIINGNRVPHMMTGNIYCMVYLFKDDILELFQVHRAYNEKNGRAVNYKAKTDITLRIEAASPKSRAYLEYEDWNYFFDTEFDKDLRIPNFLSNETKISDYIQSVADAFSLEITQSGNNISIDKRKNPLNNTYPPIINIDDRVNSNNAISENVEYPSTLAVKYKIDTDEWGFEASVPKEKMNDEDWKEYGDSGYTKIKISDDEYETDSNEINLNFSYTWYDNFKWIETDENKNENNDNIITLNLPVISKFTYMIPRYDYDESMKHDGMSLTQRLWFKPSKTDAYVWTDSYPTEKIDIYVPSNTNGQLTLNYKNETDSIFAKHFNSKMNIANTAVKLQVYLTTDEYIKIKNNARVIFDTTVWIPMQITYEVETGMAELTLLKD